MARQPPSLWVLRLGSDWQVTFPRGLAPPAARWQVVHRSSRSDHGAGPWIFYVGLVERYSELHHLGRRTSGGCQSSECHAIRFDPVTASLLFSSKPGDAGTWPNPSVMPTLYRLSPRATFMSPVSSNSQSSSCPAADRTSVSQPSAQLVQTAAVEVTQLSTDEREIFGTIKTVNGDVFTTKTRTGSLAKCRRCASVCAGESVRILARVQFRGAGIIVSSLRQGYWTKMPDAPATSYAAAEQSDDLYWLL